MAAKPPLILIDNPGSASRKYALFRGSKLLADLHFEWENEKVVCTVQVSGERFKEPVGARNLDASTGYVATMLLRSGVLNYDDKIAAIGLRVVAPSGFFLRNHLYTPAVRSKLEELEKVAPLHVSVALKELDRLEKHFGRQAIYCISDSAFHITKPEYAWNYAMPLEDADTYDIKRFGYHGLSIASAVRSLRRHERLANKIVVAHLGSGDSVTAVHGGKSLDTTMGYSPLEGLTMATRSGSIDYSAVRALQRATGMSNNEIENYLNKKSGLQGLGGSSDIRELLEREASGDKRASLALTTYVYGVQKGIAQMTAALGGIDALVFTGTVSERSVLMRRRIVDRLHYLDFYLDRRANEKCTDPQDLEVVSTLGTSRPVYVIHADEAAEMARQVTAML